MYLSLIHIFIDGYIVEMNGEPESERIETKFVAKISLENETFELFYPFVQEGEETLLPSRHKLTITSATMETGI